MFWYIIILCLLTFSMIFVYIGYVRKNDMNRIVIPMCSAILLFFMSCRSVEVGADTKQYVFGFKQICDTRFFDLFNISVYGVGWWYEINFEYGYRLFNKLVSFISQDEQAIIIATSILIIILLVILINRQSTYPFLSIWLYVTLGIFQTQMNMLRNAIAILICYLGFQYIINRNLIKYLMYIFIGIMFHLSAVLFIPFYWIVNKIKLTPKLTWMVFCIAILLGFSFTMVRSLVIDLLPFGYGRYFAGEIIKFESLAVGFFHFLLLSYIWTLMDNDEKKKAIKSENVGIWMFITEIFFFCVGYVVPAATRMAALFGPYLIILIPNLVEKGIKSNSKRFKVIAIIMLITSIQYILRLTINNIGLTMPYQFFGI